MFKIDDKNRTISISSAELLKENPTLMFFVIEKAAIIDYRLDGITWDAINKNLKLISEVPKEDIKKIIHNISENGDLRYAVLLMVNSGIHKKLLEIYFGDVENKHFKNIEIDNIETVGDYYYYLSMGNIDVFNALFGKNKIIVSYIEALNYVFESCDKNHCLRFNNPLTITLLKEAKKVSPTIINSGFLYLEIKQTIKYFNV